jgi:hypothetical protein
MYIYLTSTRLGTSELLSTAFLLFRPLVHFFFFLPISFRYNYHLLILQSMGKFSIIFPLYRSRRSKIEKFQWDACKVWRAKWIYWKCHVHLGSWKNIFLLLLLSRFLRMCASGNVAWECMKPLMLVDVWCSYIEIMCSKYFCVIFKIFFAFIIVAIPYCCLGIAHIHRSKNIMPKWKIICQLSMVMIIFHLLSRYYWENIFFFIELVIFFYFSV